MAVQVSLIFVTHFLIDRWFFVKWYMNLVGQKEASVMRKALIDIANWNEESSPYFTMCDTPFCRAKEAIQITNGERVDGPKL